MLCLISCFHARSGLGSDNAYVCSCPSILRFSSACSFYPTNLVAGNPEPRDNSPPDRENGQFDSHDIHAYHAYHTWRFLSEEPSAGSMPSQSFSLVGFCGGGLEKAYITVLPCYYDGQTLMFQESLVRNPRFLIRRFLQHHIFQREDLT